MSKKIAFIKMGKFSHTNENVLQLLTEQFTEFKIELIDIFHDLVNIIDITNILFMIKEYGWDILLGKKDFKKCLFRTTYVFKKIKNTISHHLSNDIYQFSFQTQSLFDASVKGLPHFVYTDHTHLANLDNPIFNRDNLYSKNWIELEKTIYQNATLNFTMSENISKSLIKWYSCDPNKVICVHAGCNIKSQDIKINPKKYSNKNILFVGVDWERKGGLELLKAFRIVLKTHPDAQLTIVGCSPDVNVPNCNIIGRIPIDEVNKYYENASVFCLPTKCEPLGIVFIEALTYKLPIVANNIEAVPDFILNGKSGYLVEPNKIEQLAMSLIDLIGNPKKCQSFGESGYHLIKEKYSWKKVGDKIKDHITAKIN